MSSCQHGVKESAVRQIKNDRYKQMGTAFRGRETRSSRFTVRMDDQKHLAVWKHTDSKVSDTEIKFNNDKISN